MKNKKIKTHKNLKDYLKSKFGSFLYVNYFSKIYYNIFQTSPKKLSPLAANIVQQKRIILYDDNYNRFFYKNKNFRDFFAISDQRKVPKKYLNKQFGIYPKKYGAYNIIVHLKKIFLKNGGKLIKNASVKSLDIKKNKIESINYEGLNSKIHKIDNIKYIIFSGNILFLLNLLKLKFNNNFISKPSRYYYVYCIMNNCEFFRDLYYFYDFTKSKIFRITNYYNYSYSKQHKNIICLELIPKNEMTNNEILKYLRKYFSNKKKFNSKIKKIIKIIKSYREPLPTTKNIKKIDSISKKINNLKIKNLIVNLPFFLKKNFYMFEQVETLYYYFKQKKLF